MSDNTMREGKLWAFLRDSIHEAYKKLSTTGTSNEYHALLDSIASKVADDVDARFLQVAQSEQAVPVLEGYVMVPVDLLDKFPELNEFNYSHDDVCELNAWGIDLVLSAIP